MGCVGLNRREPAEQWQEAQDILAEMNICPHCKDHKPCGCESIDEAPYEPFWDCPDFATDKCVGCNLCDEEE